MLLLPAYLLMNEYPSKTAIILMALRSEPTSGSKDNGMFFSQKHAMDKRNSAASG